MTWQTINKLPGHAKHISSGKGKYMYREREKDFLLWWQVVSISDPYDITLYASFGTDRSVGKHLEHAIEIADYEWNHNKEMVTDGVKCSCGKSGTNEPHACPFALEVYDDDTPICFCCAECEKECADDV